MSVAGSTSRDSILKKLRNGLAGAQSVFRDKHDPDDAVSVPSAVTNAVGSREEIARAFGENLEAVLGSYEIVKHPSEVAVSIAARIVGWRAENDGVESYGRELLSWAPAELPIPDLGQQLAQQGIELFVPSALDNKDQRAHSASLNVGLTGIDAAFAGTGSMVLLPGPGKSRAASLLPLHHIALIPISRIYETFESWLAELRSRQTLEELFRDNAQVAFITGPSKSADIELNLTLGVHGPRDVHAIVFDDGE